MSKPSELIEWAGVPFVPMHHHDGRMFRVPGLYAFVARGGDGRRTLLYVDHAENISVTAGPGHPQWVDALRLGMNELHVCLRARERIDRLILRGHLIKRCGPLLNVLAEADADAGARALG
jgi:hypothetical protein